MKIADSGDVMPGTPDAGGGIHALVRERVEHAVAVRIVAARAAERAGERRAAAEPGDRDCRIGGAAARDHEEIVRLRFSVRLGKALDLKYFVEHDDARA